MTRFSKAVQPISKDYVQPSTGNDNTFDTRSITKCRESLSSVAIGSFWASCSMQRRWAAERHAVAFTVKCRSSLLFATI